MERFDLDSRDIEAPIAKIPSSLPLEIKKFLKSYGVFTNFFIPFLDWLIQNKLPKNYADDINYFDPVTTSAWKNLATGKAIILLLITEKTRRDRDEEIHQILSKFATVCKRTSRMPPGSKKFDPASVLLRFTIIIELEKLPELKKLAHYFPVQIQIFPSKQVH